MLISFVGLSTPACQRALESLKSGGHSVFRSEFGPDALQADDISDIIAHLDDVAAGSDILVCDEPAIAALAGLAARKRKCGSLFFGDPDALSGKLYGWAGKDEPEFLDRLKKLVSGKPKMRLAVITRSNSPKEMDHVEFLCDFLNCNGIVCEPLEEKGIFDADWDRISFCLLAYKPSSLARIFLERKGKRFLRIDRPGKDRRTILEFLEKLARDPGMEIVDDFDDDPFGGYYPDDDDD